MSTLLPLWVLKEHTVAPLGVERSVPLIPLGVGRAVPLIPLGVGLFPSPQYLWVWVIPFSSVPPGVDNSLPVHEPGCW